MPKLVRERNEEEFIELRQKTLTVAQYEIQFMKLSKYAPDMVNTEEKMKHRFLQGLNLESSIYWCQLGLIHMRIW